MAKHFSEVFPDLRMEEDLRELLSLAEVERVTSNRERSSIRIYLVSPRLIEKKDIYSLEKAIRDQLFPGKQLAVKIMEKYRLSSQYTPEKLLDVYRDSLLLELKNYSIIEYSILRKAECTFPEPDLLRMTVEDTMVNRDKAGELKRVLEKVFHERCGLPAEVEFTYVPPQENRMMKQKQLQMAREVEEITLRSAVGGQLAAEGKLRRASGGSGFPGNIPLENTAGESGDGFWERAMAMASDSYVLPEEESAPWEEASAAGPARGRRERCLSLRRRRCRPAF